MLNTLYCCLFKSLRYQPGPCSNWPLWFLASFLISLTSQLSLSQTHHLQLVEYDPLSFIFPSQGEHTTTVMPPPDHPVPGWVRSQSSEVLQLVASKFFLLWPVTFYCFLMTWSFLKAKLDLANCILYENNFRKLCHCSFLWPSHEIWFLLSAIAYKGTNDSQLSKKEKKKPNKLIITLLTL